MSTDRKYLNCIVFQRLLLLALMFLLAACGRGEPEPPARNLFYEAQTASLAPVQPAPVPTNLASTELDMASSGPIFRPDLEARWSISWQCMSQHCAFTQCVGSARSTVREQLDDRWLEIDRRIEWNDGCGQRNSWLSQVDRYSGQERYPAQDMLFQFWAGARARTPQQQILLTDGRSVHVWCTGPQKAEVAEAGGWTALYDGEVCYDVRTGMLVFMSYIKRWVFTGIFEGKPYERAYFGDSESYEQLLETTNAQLSFVEE